MIFLQNKSNLPPVPPGEPPSLPVPFANYEPDWERTDKLAAKYRFVETLILVGQGGSINTFRGIYGALKTANSPKVFFVDTNEPAYLKEVRESCDPAKSLLLVISKSGETLTSLESLFYFYEFPHKLLLTSANTPLHQIAQSDPKIDTLMHPNISGRFAGLTEISMLPSLLCGFNAKSLRNAYGLESRPRVESNAWELANILWQLEQNGKYIITLSNYAHLLKDFNLLIQQLIHETIGKQGMGLTLLPVDSPESQHHTMQRMFEGRRDLAIVFVQADAKSLNIMVPESLQSIKIKERAMAVFNLTDLSKSLKAEYVGVMRRAAELGIANLTLHFEQIDAVSVGEYVFFWQMVSLYSAHLRGVNPYDQPAVESSKIVSFEERF